MSNLVRLLAVAFSLVIALGCGGTVPAHERPGVIPRDRHFNFQGWTWWTRADNGGPSGPGGNRWDDGPSAARVTTRGLELTMKRDAAGLWRSVEAMTPLPHRYGCLEVTLEGFVDRHPPEVVVALFVYRDDTSEFDVEWTRFGRAERPNAQYTIASTHPLRQKTFRLRQSARNHTVKLDWKRRSLVFESTDGPRWTHRGPEVPKPDGHYLHVALWRVDDLAPRDGRQVTLVIRTVTFDEHCDERRP